MFNAIINNLPASNQRISEIRNKTAEDEKCWL